MRAQTSESVDRLISRARINRVRRSASKCAARIAAPPCGVCSGVRQRERADAAEGRRGRNQSAARGREGRSKEGKSRRHACTVRLGNEAESPVAALIRRRGDSNRIAHFSFLSFSFLPLEQKAVAAMSAEGCQCECSTARLAGRTRRCICGTDSDAAAVTRDRMQRGSGERAAEQAESMAQQRQWQ